MTPSTEGAAPARPDARRVAATLYAVAVVVYALFAGGSHDPNSKPRSPAARACVRVLGERLCEHSPDNHFAYLADAYLHRTLAVRCDPALLARDEQCPPGGGGNDWARYNERWFVAFPSFPAALYMPFVGLFGRNFPNRIVDVLMAGLSPALLYLLLEKLSRKGYSPRSWRENVALAALFAFGTVYFFTAVQGSVWFVAHVVGCALAAGFAYYALDCERPLLAGLLLGLSFHARTSMLFGAIFFGMEALRVHRRAGHVPLADDAPPVGRLIHWLRGTDLAAALRPVVRFALPVAALIALYMVLNKLRFGSWSEPGYRYLQIRWQSRIARWGLFNYHYLSRNLAVVLALLPWMSRVAPYVQISRHGLALWFTTPHYLEAARPARSVPVGASFGVAALAIALVDLLYQNSGWVQFGYRFSNDYAILLVAMLAVSGRRVGRAWLVILAFAVAVNAFGAATFDRANGIYQGDNDAQGMLQPD